MYTVEELAELIEMHPRTIRRYIREGKLKANKVGGEWRISEEDVSMFMGRKVRKLHDDTRHNIEDYLSSSKSEIEGKYQVCSVIDCYIDSTDAARISQELIKFMNDDNPDRGKAKFQYFYLQEEKKSRFVLWGNPVFVGKMLSAIGELTKSF
jgi:excisionase family DNA binding protein